MNKYLYTLTTREGDKWIKKEYKTFPTEQMDELDAQNKIWKLTITKEVNDIASFIRSPIRTASE